MKLHELIKLKAKYGTVYIVEDEGKLYVCREPTLSEVIAQEAVKNAYELNELEMYIELAKVTLVLPKNPVFEEDEDGEYIPDYILEELQDQLAVDVPYNSRELEIRQNSRLTDLVKKEIDIRTLATQIWMITGHNSRLDVFYSLPLSTQIDMLALILFEQTMKNTPPEKAQEMLEKLGLAEPSGTTEPAQVKEPSPQEVLTKTQNLDHLKRIQELISKVQDVEQKE